MKRIIFFICLALLLLTSGLFGTVLATTDVPCDPAKGYCLLAPLNSSAPTQINPSNLVSEYVIPLYYIFIGLSGVLAVLVIVVGGFLYISSDSITGKTSGRTWVKNALIGLVLILGSGLILQTINPNLLKLTNIGLNLPSTTPEFTPVEGTGILTGGTKYYVTVYTYLNNNIETETSSFNANYDLCMKNLNENIKNTPGFVRITQECKESEWTEAPKGFYFTYRHKRGTQEQGPFANIASCNRDAELKQKDAFGDDNDITKECSKVGTQYCFTFKNKDEEKQLCFNTSAQCSADRNWIDLQTDAKDNTITNQCNIR